MHAGIFRVLRFNCRPYLGDSEDNARDHDGRNEDFKGEGVTKAGPLPSREDSKRPVEPTHVPVGLHGIADFRRVIGSELPDRVDLSEPSEQRRDARDQEDETGGLGREDRHHRSANDVLFCPTLALELGVLLGNKEYQVSGD